jgi:hypothetical protein
MKLYLKVIRCSCYTYLPQSSPIDAQRALKKVAPDTPPMAQRQLTIVTSSMVHTGTYMQIRAKDKEQYNNTIKQHSKLS